jgi:PAS domain S-box-containing protein
MRVDADGVFLAWGVGLEAVFGYTEAELLGRKVDVLIPSMLRAKHWEGFNEAVSAGRMRRPGKTFRSVGVHKNGNLVPFRSIDILNFADDGTVQGVTAIILRDGWRSLLARISVDQPEQRDDHPHKD